MTPPGALFLQRAIGNRAAVRLLTPPAISHTTVPTVQRVDRSELKEGTWVAVNAAVGAEGLAIETGTHGVVVELPPATVRVKLKSGAFDGKTVEIGADKLDLDSAGAARNLDANRAQAVRLVIGATALLGPAAAEIEASVNSPEKIDQGGFNFCGPNDFLMAVALRDPVAYVSFVIEVYRAQAEFKAGGPKPGKTANIGRMSVAMDPMVLGATSGSFKGGKISQTDWLTMGSLRSHGTQSATLPALTPDVMAVVGAFKSAGAAGALKVAKSTADVETAIMVVKKDLAAGPGTSLSGLASGPQTGPVPQLRTIAEGTMPSEVAGWFAGFGATDVVTAANTFDRGRTEKDIRDADADLAAGKAVMLQIDSRGLQGGASTITHDPTKGHWVLMKSAFTKGSEPDPIWSCTVYTWGATKTLQIVTSKIPDAFYGRVSAVIATPY